MTKKVYNIFGHVQMITFVGVNFSVMFKIFGHIIRSSWVGQVNIPRNDDT